MTSGTFSTTPLSSIDPNRPGRQRRALTGIPELADSIKRLGLIHPIVITKDQVLVAGERRLEACKSLGWTSIPIQFVEDLDPMVLHLIELEENVKRVDLTWQDRVAAVEAYHEIRKTLEPEWTYEKTSEAIGLPRQHVNDYVAVAKEIKAGNTKVTSAPKYSIARGIVVRAEDRKKGAEIDKVHEIIGQEKPKEIEAIINSSFLDWAPGYSGPRFNFIHCDFPYGIGADTFDQGAAPLHGGYADTRDTYFSLLECLAANIDRIALGSCHLMFWMSMRYYQETLDFFESRTPFEMNFMPLIWHKTDNSGIIPDAQRGPRQVYETCLFGSRGDRKIVRAKSNAYGAPSQKDIHMSIKPVPVLNHFFEMFVDNSTLMLDPTCGSGSALRAAETLHAQTVLGLEINSEFAESAKLELSKARKLRKVA